MAHAAVPADEVLLQYANACRTTDPASASYSSSPPSQQPSRSPSPKFNIADFESSVQFPHSALTSGTSRDTSYASQSAIDDLDFARTSNSNSPAANRYSRGLNTSFLKRSASKLLPRAIATANLPATPPASQPASGASSPTKSLSSFITGNNSTLSSSATKASVRARTASRVIFDNYFNGDSNKVHIGVLPPQHHQYPYHSRNNSVASSSFGASSPVREDGYEPDYEPMASPAFTRSPTGRTRPRRSPTVESTSPTYAGKLGAWWNSSKQSPSKPNSPTSASDENDDPLLTLDVQNALFPHGPVDPLNPSSFNDLLAAAEAVISTYQNAYRQRVAEIATVRSEAALAQDELEECETRARHLKMQLVDLSEQCTAQTRRAEELEEMVRERSSVTLVESYGCEGSVANGSEERRRDVHHRGEGSRAGSDSGFESDGESVFSAHQGESHIDGTSTVRVKSQQLAPTSRPLSKSNGDAPMVFSGHHDLRSENEMLRARVLELEGAVEGCLDMLSNPLAL